jgi:hypothetical protein
MSIFNRKKSDDEREEIKKQLALLAASDSKIKGMIASLDLDNADISLLRSFVQRSTAPVKFLLPNDTSPSLSRASESRPDPAMSSAPPSGFRRF